MTRSLYVVDAKRISFGSVDVADLRPHHQDEVRVLASGDDLRVDDLPAVDVLGELGHAAVEIDGPDSHTPGDLAEEVDGREHEADGAVLSHKSSPSNDRAEAATSVSMQSIVGGAPDALLETPSAEKRVEELAGEGVTRTPAGTPTSASTASPHDGAAGTPAELRPPTQPAGNTTGRAE